MSKPRQRAPAALSSLLLSLFLSLLAHLPLEAQDDPSRLAPDPEDPLVVLRIDEPIPIDGDPRKAVWEEIEPLIPITHVPNFGAAASERTEFRLAHDGEHLYFSCRAYDSDPAGIQALSLERNESGFGSDTCAIYLDTLDDQENALGFRTTPAGNRSDFHFTNDAEGPPNSDWDTFWDVAVSQDEKGWYAEFRIPFSSLLFQTRDGRVTMGVSILRSIARKSERVTYPGVSPQWGTFAFAKPSQMGTIVLEGVEQRNPLHITPYTLAGGGHSHEPTADAAGIERRSTRVTEAGADVRYGLTSNLTLDLTVNTDFAQVEADDQQVNLTRFSLFFPEKRRFFQERAPNFEYSLGGQERLFHSRQVGLAAGEPVRIYGGARLVGRVGEWDIGLLNMQTAESELLPSENQGVFRLRRRVLNRNSYVGGIVTSRLGSGGGHNIVYGTDALLRVVGDEYLRLNWAQSFDHAEDPANAGVGVMDRTLIRANWERRGADGFTYGADLTRAGQVFDPGMGFLMRRDYVSGDLGVGYGWRPGPESPLLRYGLDLDLSIFRRNEDRTVETVEVGLQAVVESKSNHQLTVSVPFQYESLDTSFPLLGDLVVPAGIHRFAGGRIRYGPPQGDAFRPGVTLEAGRFFDGRQISLSLDPSWSPSRHFRLDGSYRVDRVEFSDRGESVTSHVGGLRAEVMVSTATSAVGFVQFNSVENAVIANFRFRYNPREGNDLFLVWNEGLVTNRNAFDPVRPRSDERTILVKYSHTLEFSR